MKFICFSDEVLLQVLSLGCYINTCHPEIGKSMSIKIHLVPRVSDRYCGPTYTYYSNQSLLNPMLGIRKLRQQLRILVALSVGAWDGDKGGGTRKQTLGEQSGLGYWSALPSAC
jgi:hypothetical protein